MTLPSKSQKKITDVYSLPLSTQLQSYLGNQHQLPHMLLCICYFVVIMNTSNKVLNSLLVFFLNFIIDLSLCSRHRWPNGPQYSMFSCSHITKDNCRVTVFLGPWHATDRILFSEVNKISHNFPRMDQ